MVHGKIWTETIRLQQCLIKLNSLFPWNKSLIFKNGCWFYACFSPTIIRTNVRFTFSLKRLNLSNVRVPSKNGSHFKLQEKSKVISQTSKINKKWTQYKESTSPKKADNYYYNYDDDDDDASLLVLINSKLSLDSHPQWSAVPQNVEKFGRQWNRWHTPKISWKHRSYAATSLFSSVIDKQQIG